MKFEIFPKSDIIPSYDPNAVTVKYIEDNSHGEQYEEDEITPDLISKILHEVPKEIEIILYLDPDGEGHFGCLEVVSDGNWLSLCYDHNETETYFCYNSEFADTVAQLEEVDLRDKNVYSPIDYDGQIPVPKCQAITDMDAGVKAIEYFIRTGTRYPGIDWGYCP
ncbi:hypothetical protein C810_04315 [Lachnospiraceae bacterium A2]|nr:hypothetical protein C810_04315 [Lachnospiraceae bacterium A2]